MTPWLLGHLRTAVTLAVLAVLLAVGVAWGLSAVTAPFPENTDPPLCVDTPVSAGDVLRPGGITVSVINAGEQPGLAGRTLEALTGQGFAGGRIDNAPDESVRTSQIWSAGGATAPARLLRTYLGGKVRIVERQGPSEGLTVVVGDQFPGVRTGRAQLKADADGVVCAPEGL